MTPELALSWQLGPNFGWGLFGIQIAIQLKLAGRANPILLSRMLPYLGDPIERGILDTIWAHNRGPIQRLHDSRPPGDSVRLQVPLLNALGNNGQRQFVHPDLAYEGTVNHGLVFLENPLITETAFERYDRFDTLTAGSTWAADVLRDRGIPRTGVCIQGVDPALFHPAPAREILRDRFVIFSGGKLEFRKGQDIVIEAVTRFRERHPETLLICLWGNPWLGGSFLKLLDKSPYHPRMLDYVGETKIDWAGMFQSVGLGPDQAKLYETLEHRVLPIVMRDADVALFPNRCEGGTNMMAMQAMACGIPSILSANSGHLDIIEDGACLPLDHQRPVTVDHPEISTDGWGESDVDEIIEALELVYQDRARAREIGAAGAEVMSRYTWRAQIDQLASMIGV